MSLTRPFAIHSIHQGESEALKINDIYHALLSIKGEKSQTILSELDASIVDKEMLHIHASTVALRVDSVIPERHGTLQSAKISEEPISPIPKRVIQDIFDFIDNFSSGAKVDFFAKMFGSIKTLYDRQFSTHQKHGTRLDIQSPTKDAANLQIQVGDQTIATVLVDLHLREYGKEHAPRQCEVSNYVLRKLRGGVNYAHTSHQAAVIKVSPLKTLGDTNEFKPSGHD